MPNWSYNNHAVKGKTEDILAFINHAIENSAKAIKEYGNGTETIPTKQDNIEDAINVLKQCVTPYNNFKYGRDKDKNGYQPILDNKVRMSTFTPVPDTFLRYDTTNDANLYKEQAKLQKQEYGVVGWYDYNIKNFSCKWDCKLEEIEQHTENGITTITFKTETPWHLPDKWCRTLQEMFPKLTFFISAEEEGNSYLFFKNYKDGEEHDYLGYVDFEDEESWYNVSVNMNNDFIDHVNNF